MTDNIMEINDLYASSNDEYYIEDINLELKKGVIHVLTGESGSGKNTFFHAMTGKANELRGKIKYKNNFYKMNSSFEGIEGVSYIRRYPDLIESLSVAENLTLFDQTKKRYLSIVNKDNINKKTKNIINNYKVKIDPEKKVNSLSFEERKIIELAKFIFQDNDLGIFYEPTDGISVDVADIFYNILTSYKEKDKTFLIITKQWDEALKIADMISVLSHGKIVGTISGTSAREQPHRLLNMLKDRVGYEEENAKVMNTIFKSAEFLTSEYELNDLLSYISKQVAVIMNADKSALDLIDEETKSSISQVSYYREKGIKGKIKINKVIELFTDSSDEFVYMTENDQNYSDFFEIIGDVKTVIFIPIIIRSRIAGILQLFYTNQYDYQEEESIYLSTLARQAGIAIEDTRLMGRSALLMESHHRIKNNLQNIVSLINIQKDYVKNQSSKEIDDILEEIISRISSIASVHDLLSKDNSGRSILNAKKLIKIIADFYKIDSRIKVKFNLDNIFMSYNKATSLALVINELLNNCYEHAFPEDKDINGLIEIICREKNDKIVLKVIDNGRGLPQDFNIDNLDSLGISIVKSIIINEFEGEIIINNNKKNTGTEITATFFSDKCMV